MSKNIKAILLGCVGVGKTNLINACCGRPFLYNERSTITSNYISKVVEVDNECYNVDLWDTAGQEKYYNVTKIFFKGAQIIIFVYDITSEQSFLGLEKWITMAEEMIEGNHICGIIGNKSDLIMDLQVNEEDCSKFAQSKRCKYKIVSALKNPKGFSDFFDELVRDLIMFRLYKTKESFCINGKNHFVKKDKTTCGC